MVELKVIDVAFGGNHGRHMRKPRRQSSPQAGREQEKVNDLGVPATKQGRKPERERDIDLAALLDEMDRDAVLAERFAERPETA
jgi:hypothetical protein